MRSPCGLLVTVLGLVVRFSSGLVCKLRYAALTKKLERSAKLVSALSTAPTEPNCSGETPDTGHTALHLRQNVNKPTATSSPKGGIQRR